MMPSGSSCYTNTIVAFLTVIIVLYTLKPYSTYQESYITHVLLGVGQEVRPGIPWGSWLQPSSATEYQEEGYPYIVKGVLGNLELGVFFSLCLLSFGYGAQNPKP